MKHHFLTATLASAVALGAVGMAVPAHALELGVGGSNTTSASTDLDTRDASGGIMTHTSTGVDAGTDIYAGPDRDVDAQVRSGVTSNLDTDTSAGADANADLRAQIREGQGVMTNDSETRNTADLNVDTDTNADVDTGLLGLSVGSTARVDAGTSFND